MALNIRLSPALDSEARAYCERVGISLNSLVGIALDAYLRRPEPVARTPQVVEPVAPLQLQETLDERIERINAQRRSEWHQRNPTETLPAAEPAVPVARPLDPKPVLSAKPTKAERTALAEWYRRNPSK